MLHQAVSYPGTTSALDEFTDVIVVPLGTGSKFATETSKLSTPRAFAKPRSRPDGTKPARQ